MIITTLREKERDLRDSTMMLIQWFSTAIDSLMYIFIRALVHSLSLSLLTLSFFVCRSARAHTHALYAYPNSRQTCANINFVHNLNGQSLEGICITSMCSNINKVILCKKLDKIWINKNFEREKPTRKMSFLSRLFFFHISCRITYMHMN